MAILLRERACFCFRWWWTPRCPFGVPEHLVSVSPHLFARCSARTELPVGAVVGPEPSLAESTRPSVRCPEFTRTKCSLFHCRVQRSTRMESNGLETRRATNRPRGGALTRRLQVPPGSADESFPMRKNVAGAAPKWSRFKALSYERFTGVFTSAPFFMLVMWHGRSIYILREPQGWYFRKHLAWSL